MESDPNDITEIYRKRWEIEQLFKQKEQNFPLKFLYVESANAIKIQILVTLIANLLLNVMKKGGDLFLEHFRSCNHDEDNAYVSCGFIQSFQSSGKGLGNPFVRESERSLSNVGLGIIK